MYKNEEYKVKNITEGAFKRCQDNLKTLTIEEGIEYIGDYCFEEFTELEKVNLPDSIKILGTSTFKDCTKLTDIKLPKNLVKIYSQSFSNCSINSVELPDNLEYIALDAFTKIHSINIPANVKYIDFYSSLSNYSTINIDKDNPNYIKNDHIIYDKDMTTAYYSDHSISGTLTLPSTIKDISEFCFYKCSNLSQINLNDGLELIGSYSFGYCTSLKSITIPKSVNKINFGLFSGCTNLSYVEFLNGSINLPNLFNDNGYFARNIRLINTNDNNLSTIDREHYNKVCLTGEDYHEVQFVAKKCNNLNLNNFILHDIDTGENLTHSFMISNDRNFTIENATNTKIINKDDCSFLINSENNTAALTSYLGKAKSFSIPETIENEGKYYKVTEIGAAFKDANSLEELTMPNSIIKISEGCFQNCPNLKKITLSDNLTEIRKYSFYNCNNLEQIIIPKKVTNIAEGAFENCTGLKKIILPDDLLEIGTKAFYNCESLNDLILPKNIQTLSQQALSHCTSLKEIIIPPSLSDMGDEAFFADSSLEKANIQAPLKDISSGLFKECTNLSEVILPNSVKVIYKSAFDNCSSLHNIKIPDSLKSVYEYAFRKSGLESITFTNKSLDLSRNSFFGCTNLRSVKLPTSLYYLAYDAFKDCTNIEYITIPYKHYSKIIDENTAINNIIITNTLNKEDLLSKFSYDFCYITIDDEDFKAIQIIKKGTPLNYPTDIYDLYENDILVNKAKLTKNKEYKLIRKSIRLSCDLNHDNQIDLSDLSLLASNYNKTYNDEDFIEEYDLNKDNICDIYDLTRVSYYLE